MVIEDEKLLADSIKEMLEGLAEGQTYYYAYYDTLEISFTPDFGGGGFAN